MKKKQIYLNNEKEKEKEPNFIIIAKPRINTTKNTRSYLTLKDGDYSVKININNSLDNKLNQQKILQTISDIRKHINNNNNTNDDNYNTNNYSKKHKLIKESQVKFIDNIDKKEKKQKPNKTTEVKNHLGDLIINNDKNSNYKNINKKNNIDDGFNNNKSNKEFSSIIIADDKLSENNKEKDNLKEIEENFVSSLNKKSVRTQLNKKDRQKSIQQSDRADISKVNSDSDNVTEFDNKIKLLVKFKYDNGQSINGDINEKEEIENELIDNDEDVITVLNNNNNNKNEDKGEKLIYNKDTLTLKKK